jgi:hypothetical protein
MATSEGALSPARRAPVSGIRRWLVDHPVTSFLFLAFLGTWICQLPMIVSPTAARPFSACVLYGLYALLALAIVIATRGQLGYRKMPAAPATLAVEHASPE